MAWTEIMDNAMGDPSVWQLPSMGRATSIELYLKRAEEIVKKAQKLTSPRGSASTKFNHELCKYLADKLSMTVQSARLFTELPHGTLLMPCSSNVLKISKVFKRFLAIAKEVEIFIQDCCKDAWAQVAMTLTNMSEHVSSLGFELELYKIIFSNSNQRLRSTEIHAVRRAEVKLVEEKASRDKETLLEKVKAELGFLSGEERVLHSFLLEKLNPVSKISAILSRRIIPAKVCDLLGKGASATVYKARWLGMECAIKNFNGPAIETDFMRESSILASLHHPNITSLYGAGRNRRSCYIVMELMDFDLHNLLQVRRLKGFKGSDSPPFPTMAQFDIMHQIARGMQYLHENNVVHWDLTSSKILFKAFKPTEYMNVKVADFGISKTKQLCRTFSRANTGTMRWRAPEVLCNLEKQIHTSDGEMLKYPFKADVYSFAMVCSEILTGVLPFPTISGQSVVKKVLNGERPRLPDHCPNELRLLIEKCWGSEPNRRPSFAKIICELENLKYLELVSRVGAAFMPWTLKLIPAPNATRSSRSRSLKRARTLRSQLQQLGVESSATWLSKRVTPTTVPDEAVSSPCSFLESAFTLQQQLQQLGEGPSVACLPKMTAPIHVPGEIGPSPCNSFQSNFALQQQPNLLEERTSTIGLPESTTLITVTDEVKSFPCSSSGLPDRTTSITVAEEAGSSPCSTFESAYMFQMQPVEKGTSATCLPEKTIPTPGPNIVGSSPCTSFARACMSRSQQCQLGRGASATVYKVSRFGRWVAKKVFFGLDHPEFENEVSILKPLSNPNIMSLLDSGKEKDSCYILMELMDCDLLQLLERLLEQNCDSFPFTIAEAVDIMLQLAEGMKYLHENKIVHGDLKSPNILIKILENECVDARVGDFGLAKTNKKSRTYSDQEYNLGTDRWMAPELIKFPSRGGDQVNAPGFENTLKYPYKIDVHSFAVICSEILTGERPFPTIGSSKEVKQKVLNGDRPDLPDHCPKRLKYLIERCWDEDPSKRPTFAEICKELKQISNQLRATVQDIQIIKVAASCSRKGMVTGHTGYASISIAHTWLRFSKVRDNLFIQVSLLIVGVFLGIFLGVLATLVGMGVVPFNHSR